MKSTGVVSPARRLMEAAASIRAGVIGEPLACSATVRGKRAVKSEDTAECSVRTVLDDAAAMAELVCGLMDRTATSVCIQVAGGGGEREEAAVVQVGLSDGAVAVIEIAQTLPPSYPEDLEAAIEIYGSAGAMSVDLAADRCRHYGDGAATAPVLREYVAELERIRLGCSVERREGAEEVAAAGGIARLRLAMHESANGSKVICL